jgi:hypothetical protein
MHDGILLNVVVAERATILQLLSSEDYPLLVEGNPSYNPLSVRGADTRGKRETEQTGGPGYGRTTTGGTLTSETNAVLQQLDSVRGGGREGVGLSSEGLHEDLHVAGNCGELKHLRVATAGGT